MPPELQRKSDISIVLILFTALAVIGVAGGGFVVRDYARARASLVWPAVDGIVLSQLDHDSGPVRYVYSYDGRSYESSRRKNFMGLFTKVDEIDFRPGESIVVYVDPKQHDYSVLYPGGSSAAFVILSLLCGAAVFFGIGGVVWALSRTREEAFSMDGQAA